MHGVVFSELRKYVDARLGAAAWNGLLTAAGLGQRLYLPVTEYPDEELVAIVSAASRTTGMPVDALQQDFGTFAAPNLIGMYKSLIKPTWRALDVLENTEQTIHTTVRRRNPGAAPPKLHITRTGDEVVIRYTSARKMCAFGKGLIAGIAKHFGDTVAIDETSCMCRGSAECRIVVRSTS
jgi:hypothetical protein